MHRDLKPENVFIHAMASSISTSDSPSSPTIRSAERHVHHGAGVVLGTVGYMAPEQARGETSDSRSDIFSFGAVLYEMLSGERAFQGNSSIETLSAILREQPADLTHVVPGLSPALARIVDRCLEKDKDDRFQTASDLGFALDAISGFSTPAVASPRRSRVSWKLVGAIAVAALAVAGALAVGRTTRRGQPQFHQLTFRRGTVQGARSPRMARRLSTARRGRAVQPSSTPQGRKRRKRGRCR